MTESQIPIHSRQTRVLNFKVGVDLIVRCCMPTAKPYAADTKGRPPMSHFRSLSQSCLTYSGMRKAFGRFLQEFRSVCPKSSFPRFSECPTYANHGTEPLRRFFFPSSEYNA